MLEAKATLLRGQRLAVLEQILEHRLIELPGPMPICRASRGLAKTQMHQFSHRRG
jgi:hypothetical protein